MAAVGRPTVMTPEVVKKLELAFMLGFTDEQAAFFAEISRRTLHNYQKSNPEFLHRKEDLKNHLEMRVKVNLAAQISPEVFASLPQADREFLMNSPNATQLSQWWAERKLPKEFGNKQKVTFELDEEVNQQLNEFQQVVHKLRSGDGETVQGEGGESIPEQGTAPDLRNDSPQETPA